MAKGASYQARRRLEGADVSKLAEIKALLAAITPELWVAVARHSGNDGTQDEMSGLGWDIEGPPEPMRGQFSRCADAQFAAHSPEYVALLLAVVETMLENASPANEAMVARKSAEMSWAKRTPGAVQRMIEKAEAWEGIA